MGKNKKKNYQAKQHQNNPPPAGSQSSTVLNNSVSHQSTVIIGQSKILKEVISSDSEISVSDFQDNQHKQKVAFSIKQWFHLGLSKIFPPSDKSINIDLIKNEVWGQKSKVEKFCEKAQKQIDSMVIKIIKLKLDISPDTIMYEMDQDWKCQIFTVQLLRKVWEKINKTYKVNEQMKNQIQNILNKDGINKATRFLWVLKNVQEQAVDIVKKIHKQQKEKQSESIQRDTTVLSSRMQQKPYKIQQIPSRIQQTISQSKFIQQINKQKKKQEEKPQKKPFDDDSDEFDFTQLVINANSKNPKQKTLILNEKAKENKTEIEEILKLLDEPQTSIIKPNQESFDSDQQDQTARVQRGNRIAPKRKTIFVCEYPEQYLDKNHLKKWVKGNRHLSIRDLQINEKLSEQDKQMYIQIIIYGDQMTKDKQYSINLYFRHEKVIKLDPEDQELHKKIIERFVSDNSWLKIEHKKIYTREKNPKYDTLKEFCKRDNSAKNMNTTHKNLTHVLYIIGLITQVSQMEAEVQAFIKVLQNTCRKVQIVLKFDSISDFMREKRLQSFIDSCIRQFMDKQTEKHKLLNIKFVYSEVVAQIELYGVPQKELKNAEQNITQKLHGIIDHFEIQPDGNNMVLGLFDKLSKKYLLFKTIKNSIILIAKSKQIKEQMASINNQVKQSLIPVMKEIVVKQKSEFTLTKDFMLKKSKEINNPNIQIRFQEGKEFKVVFIGPQILVNSLVAKLQEFLENLEGKIWQYNIPLSDEQIDIIEKDKELHKQIEDKWKITFKSNRNYSIAAIINVKPHDAKNVNFKEKIIIFQKQYNFESLQQNSIFFFRNRKEIESLKLAFILPFKALVDNKKNSLDAISDNDKQRKCHFIFKDEANPTQIIEESKKCNPNVIEICLYLSESIYNFFTYLKNLIKVITSDKQFASKQLKITIICKKNQDLKKILNLKEGKHVTAKTRKWYTTQGQKKLYYSDSGNKKIEEAFKNSTNNLQLNNQDINLTVTTHSFDFDKKIMTHMQSGNQFSIEIHQNRITVNLNGTEKMIPDSQYQKIPKNGSFWSSKKLTNCNLSIGFYRIDLTAKTQTNLFSNFKRDLAYEQNEAEDIEDYDLAVNYEVKTNKLTLEYSHENQKFLKMAVDHMKKYFEGKLIEIVKPFDKQFTLQLIGQFEDEGKQQNIKIFQSQDGKQAIFKAYNEKNIENFVKMLTHLGKAKVHKKINIQFPKEWQVQTNDIQTFVVDKNTTQFANVQKAFTAGTIFQLIRIQNKSVYKKYMEEKAFLKELNEGKDIKEMFLFHGTRQTDPKAIYEDKEDCFNINYTSQGNLLGRGTYFAERSEYSVNYSYKDNRASGVESMFYCQVLVGQSQKCLKHNGDIRDTDYKDPVKRIKYESMTDFLQGSNVFVVYKNRRGYPLYLIKYRSKGMFGF